MTNQLISLTELIKLAKGRNISLGNGDPEEHIFYLGKLGLLPRAVRRKSEGKLVGHYDLSTLDLLEKISSLKSRGLTYSQIKKQRALMVESRSPMLGNDQRLEESVPFQQGPPVSAFHLPIMAPNSNALYLLAIGLLLGYIFATNGFPKISVGSVKAVSTSPMQTVTAGQEQGSFLQMLNSSLDTDRETIYVIQGPKNSFKNLGKVDVKLQ